MYSLLNIKKISYKIKKLDKTMNLVLVEYKNISTKLCSEERNYEGIIIGENKMKQLITFSPNLF